MLIKAAESDMSCEKVKEKETKPWREWESNRGRKIYFV